MDIAQEFFHFVTEFLEPISVSSTHIYSFCTGAVPGFIDRPQVVLRPAQQDRSLSKCGFWDPRLMGSAYHFPARMITTSALGQHAVSL